jgi:single-strand DNA-binding protein
MAGDINRVTITGRLTRDPELRAMPSGDRSVCSLRVAVNGRRRNSEGQWEDAPNFFDVSVWGPQGENCQRYLAKGREVAIDGSLRWREWTDKSEQKRQSVDIIADNVKFLGGGGDQSNGNGNGYQSGVRAPETDIPVDTNDFVAASVSSGAAAEDDIPF